MNTNLLTPDFEAALIAAMLASPLIFSICSSDPNPPTHEITAETSSSGIVSFHLSGWKMSPRTHVTLLIQGSSCTVAAGLPDLLMLTTGRCLRSASWHACVPTNPFPPSTRSLLRCKAAFGSTASAASTTVSSDWILLPSVEEADEDDGAAADDDTLLAEAPLLATTEAE